MTRLVTGTYHDEKKAADAIQELIGEGVPLDELSVVIADAGSQRDVPIVHETAEGRAVVAGTAIGAVVGGVGAVLVTTGVLAAPGIGLLAAGPVLAILRGAIAGAFIGDLIGVHAGLAFWKKEAEIHEGDLRDGAALIAVHSDDLHDAARAVFERTGADRISG